MIKITLEVKNAEPSGVKGFAGVSSNQPGIAVYSKTEIACLVGILERELYLAKKQEEAKS